MVAEICVDGCKRLLWGARQVVFYVGVVPATVLFGFLSPLLFIFPDKGRYWFITRWSHFFIRWATWVLGLRYKIHGRIPHPKTPFVVLSNHQSAWETVFMQTVLPMQSWLLKKELLYIPFFGWGLALLKPIAIKREKKGSYHQLIKQGTERLQEGRWVVIFPEGTRVAPHHYHRFARGGASLALEAQAPILPIAHNAGLFWPRGWFARAPGVIQVSVGPVITPKRGESATDLMARVEHWIRDEMKRLSALSSK